VSKLLFALFTGAFFLESTYNSRHRLLKPTDKFLILKKKKQNEKDI